MRDDTNKRLRGRLPLGWMSGYIVKNIVNNIVNIMDDLGSFSTTTKFFLRTTLVPQYLTINIRKDGLPEN